MTSAVHVKPAIHGSAAAAGKLSPLSNLGKDRDRKVRFEERGKGNGNTAGITCGDDRGPAGAAVKQQQPQQGMIMAERLAPTPLPDAAVILKDERTGELLPFGEHKAQQEQRDANVVHEGQDNRRLRGKLKWLFEQDRMYWESNSSKSSLRGSPEVDHSKGPSKGITSAPTTAAAAAVAPTKNLPAAGECTNDAKFVQAVEQGLKMKNSKKFQVRSKKPPRQPPPVDSNGNSNEKSKVPREESCIPERPSSLPSTKMPWRFTNSSAKFWPRAGKGKVEESKNISGGEKGQSLVPPADTSRRFAEHDRRLESNDSVTLMSSLDLGAEGYFTDDFEDMFTSGRTNDLGSSEEDTRGDEGDDDFEDTEDDEEARKGEWKMGGGGGGGGAGVDLDGGADRSLKAVKNQAAYLKAKCDTLCKEKNDAVRKWQKSCREIDEAAKMAQALRTAIETLLEAGATDSSAEFRARQDILEGHTQALKARMAKLRKQNSHEFRKRAYETKSSSRSLHDRIETLKKTSEGRSLASPEIPRDTEHKVEALRARLEKLMLATNSRVSDEQGQVRRKAREQKRQMQEPPSRRSDPSEKGELKMKGWLNSLSAELSTEEFVEREGSVMAVCEKSSGGTPALLVRDIDLITPSASKQGTPSTSKQVSPMQSFHERESSGSAPSSEETKKMVIHKIAEEVRLEAEQWFQVQELLGRVGEDMKSLQEACTTWERRAIVAEAQVAQMQQEEQEKMEKAKQLEGEKIAELQKEMSRLRQTIEDVRNQLGIVNIDPSRWFEAAHHFGYAFMPAHPPLVPCACKGKCKSFSCDAGTPDSSDCWKQKGAVGPGKAQPSSSANSSAAPSVISSCEKSPGESELRHKPQIPSNQPHWAGDVDRVEKEFMKGTDASTGQLSGFEYCSTTMQEIPHPTSSGSTNGGRQQERPVKGFNREQADLESSGARGDLLYLQMQSSIRDRCNILHPDDQFSRFSNFISVSRRSPLRDVLENIASSKENKRPF